LPIDAGARSLQSEVDDVRAKDLNSHGVAEHPQQLMHEDRNRVHFFAGRTTGYPDPEGFARSVRERAAQDLAQGFERSGVAEETRNVDQEIPVEVFEFGRIVLCECDVIGQSFELVDDHAPPNAPSNSSLFVMREINGTGSLQHLEQFLKM